MPVTLKPAIVARTCTYVYATGLDKEGIHQVHVCGYQNKARSLDGPNIMFLNFPGTNLQLVSGPEQTETVMKDITRRLPELRPDLSKRVGAFSWNIRPEEYGTYTVVLAEGPEEILPALDQMPENRRLARSGQLRRAVEAYTSLKPQDSFAICCFDGKVKPGFPITVSYTPHNPRVLVAPGWDGLDGTLPMPGRLVRRDARVAFAIQGVSSPHAVYYEDELEYEPWAPQSVCGFVDNRPEGPNSDYVVPVDMVRAGLTGRALAATLL